jgi:hypothetical protein
MHVAFSTLGRAHPLATPTQRSCVCAAAASPNGSVPPAWPGYVPAPKSPKHVHGSGPKPFSLIGSTGSIGTQTLDIVAEFPEHYRVVALSAGSNVALLADQVWGPHPWTGAQAPPARERAPRAHALCEATHVARRACRVVEQAPGVLAKCLAALRVLTGPVGHRSGASSPAW